MKFYIRLLSYKEACSIIEYINSFNGCFAGITPGGVSVSCKGLLSKGFIKDELHRNYPRFEITEDHPKQVEKQIVNDLKLLNAKS